MDKLEHIVLKHRKAPDSDYPHMVPGVRYTEVVLPHEGVIVTPENAVLLAEELIKSSGLPYAIINLSKKREEKPKIEPKYYPPQEPTKE